MSVLVAQQDETIEQIHTLAGNVHADTKAG